MLARYVCKALLGESTVTDLLTASYFSSYPIFYQQPAPSDAPEPLITVVDEGSEIQDNRVTDGGRVTLAIRIWCNKDHDMSDLHALGDAVRAFLHKKTDYTLDSGSVINANCSFPQYTTIDGFPVAIMDLELMIRDI